VVSVTNPYGRNLDFLDGSRYFFQVAPQVKPCRDGRSQDLPDEHRPVASRPSNESIWDVL
jgi:hypothetical protein